MDPNAPFLNSSSPADSRIGIFGGSFNPPTKAHEALSIYARRALGLEKLWLLLAPHNPLKDKKDLAPFTDRMEMCKIAMREYADWLEISDLEHQFGTQQTSDTLDRILERFPNQNFAWLMGADNLVHFHSWDRWQDIISKVPVYIFARPHQVEPALLSPAAKIMGPPAPASADLTNLVAGQWALLPNPEMDVAATKIRQALAAGYKPENLSDSVLTYIKDMGLYTD
jgi:nicotinate-nucleotide adenylyltransferase